MAAPVIEAAGLDAGDAFELSAEAGWNQTVDDWERMKRLAPGGCFFIRDGGELAATSIGLAYGKQLAWIGMVLTRVAHRGKGYAGALMRRTIESLDAAGVQCIKLDATDLGRPVYLKLGFEDEQPVSRWMRKPGTAAAADSVANTLDEESFELDREAFGADRRALLAELSRHEVYAVAGAGHAFARPGRQAWHFGPSVARDAETAARLLADFVARHSCEPAILDLLDNNQEAVELARGFGFEPVRRLVRMARGSGPRGRTAAIHALAGFEYG